MLRATVSVNYFFMRHFGKKILILITLIILSGGLAATASATLNVGLEEVGSTIALSNQGPIEIATKVINIFLGLLGIIAVSLIIYAGFLWMTAGGSEDKIAQAKKILKNSAIGLLIILSSWGIAYFVLSRLTGDVFNGGSGADGCSNGSVVSCGCGGEQICSNGVWGPCLGSFCDPGSSSDPVSCDGKAEVSGCQADSNICGLDYLCDDATCECKPRSGWGEACNSDKSGSGRCEANDSLCGPYLKCNNESCLCEGPPVITAISPVGGFCSNDQDRGCNYDSDCLSGGNCDQVSPNGAANNFLTLYGYNFGSLVDISQTALTQINFESGSVGGIPASWAVRTQQKSQAGISQEAARSGTKSLKIGQAANLPYPGVCNRQVCTDLNSCTWNEFNRTCTFNQADEKNSQAPSVYREGESLFWGNTNRVMWAEATYDLAPLDLRLGDTYTIQFYYQGKNDAAINLTITPNPGWNSQCLGYDVPGTLKSGYVWDGGKVTPSVSGGEDPCLSDYGQTCADQPNNCCFNAPAQKKCYQSLNLPAIPSGETADWTLYSYTFQYTPEMASWVNSSGNKILKLAFSIGYNRTSAVGTNFYIDDFLVLKNLTNGRVSFLGADPSQTQAANFPNSLNPNCVSYWTDRQITVAVPSGAMSGPIMIEREGLGENNSDTTNDNIGPKIPDFVRNNVYRPGLCQISPEAGQLGDRVSYQGINLRDAVAYFGKYNNAYQGINSSFAVDNLSGQALAPNINSGQTTTFVERTLAGINQKSNALKFIKNKDPEAGPYISGFSPVSGPAGQYLTITGGGFGNLRGSRQVFIGNQEASYEFPEVCTSAVWSDSQIVVKIPEGLSSGYHQIRINLGNAVINSDLLAPNNAFRFDSNESLKTSLCKISPERGQVGDTVSLWGEYFGLAGSQATVVFNRGVNTSAPVQKENRADKIVTTVPISANGTPAITGPVRVLKNSEWGNELNFIVGQCTANDECGAATPVCCPTGTYKSGSCETDLLSCYFQVPNSVYETRFDTSSSGTGTETDYADCQGLASAFGTCQTGQLCPNSPGKCSPFDGSIPKIGKICGADLKPCGALTYCQGNDCLYNQVTDTCRANSCLLEQSFTYYLGDKEYSGLTSCRPYTGPDGQTALVKHLKVETSCPDGWQAAGQGYCVGNAPTPCDTCEVGFKCVADNYQSGDIGVCESAKICSSSGAYCGFNAQQPGQLACLIPSESSCDCCCEIGQDARDCCVPLKCGGTCGSDQSADGVGFGFCTGCTAAGNTAAERDAACNCLSTSGKFCDISKPEGICVDCGALDEAGCLEHSTQCCFDQAKQTCQGGDGTKLADGRCAYYDCDANDKTICNENPAPTGRFKKLDTCQETCPEDPRTVCDLATTEAECSQYDACCFDAKNNKCTNGTDKIIAAEGINYCAYYNCEDEVKEIVDPETGESSFETKKVCDDSTAAINGEYLGLPECRAQCAKGPNQPGNSCHSDLLTACDTSICQSPYECLGTEECGFCCCTPGDKLNENLVCVADKGNCTGGDRGLFCGCTKDEECGGDVGCGNDTCCHARPQVINVLPKNDQANVCRNAQIKIEFNEMMQIGTLANNILLVEERDYADGACPSGTLIADGGPDERSFFVRLIARVKNWFNSSPSALAALPASGKLYCAKPVELVYNPSFYNNQPATTVFLRPQELLAANARYFVLVKGDESADSNSGVLNIYGVGMKTGRAATFNIRDFNNVYVTSFETLDDKSQQNGLCEIDSVKLDPTNILLNNPDNNTTDDNPSDAKFDTVNDNDRAFYANAYSKDGQIIQPVIGYYWNWRWSLDNRSVVETVPLSGLLADRQVVRSLAGVTDNSTKIKVLVDMDGATDNISFVGNGYEAKADIQVFLCANPWPPVRNGLWQPWYDSCRDRDGRAIAGCLDYNYKFYYCRDAGEPGTADDLPLVIDPALILGSSGSLVCSTDNSPCSSAGAACGSSGTCIWSILKESYFFRETIPLAGEIWEIKSTGQGGELRLSWSSPLSLDVPIVAFKLYYGLAGSNKQSFIKTVPLGAAACSIVDQKQYCSHVVSGLIDGEKYIFRMTALTENQAESPLSGAREAFPTDTTPPAIPQGLKAELNENQLTLSWLANRDDTQYYRLFHGIFPGKRAAESFDSQNKATRITLETNNFQAGEHYFYLVAVDNSGNISLSSSEIKVTIP